jgi:uncharacterized FlaG/YvyC family protein
MDVNANITRVDGPAPRYVVPSRADRADDRPVERPKADDKPSRARKVPEPDLKFTLRTVDADARFTVHEATKSVIVTIVDRTTGEVIREIPSRRYLDLVAAISGKGTILDEKR